MKTKLSLLFLAFSLFTSEAAVSLPVSGINRTLNLLDLSDLSLARANLKALRKVDTVAQLVALTGADKTNMVHVLGYSAAGDFGGGAYRWVSGGNYAANLGAVFTVTGGQWRLLHDGQISVTQFGAKGDYSTDDIAAIQNLVDYACQPTNRVVDVHFPPGDYIVSDAIKIHRWASVAQTGLVYVTDLALTGSEERSTGSGPQANGSSSVIHLTQPDTAAVLVNFASNVGFKGLGFVGKNNFVISRTAFNTRLDVANFIKSGASIRDNSYSPHAGIVFDYARNVSGYHNISMTATRSGTTATVTTSLPHLHANGATVTNSTVGKGMGIAAGNVTRSGSTATVITPAAHGLATSDTVTISGAAQTEYNVTTTVTVLDTTTFTYAVAGTPVTPATGNIDVTTTDAGFPATDWNKTTTVTVLNSTQFTYTVNANSTYAASGLSSSTANQYPRQSAQYTSGNSGGSTRCKVIGCYFTHFVVGVLVSATPVPGMQNAEDMYIEDCTFNTNRDALGLGQSQTRNCRMDRCQVYDGFSAINCTTYGARQGSIAHVNGFDWLSLTQCIIGNTGYGGSQISSGHGEEIISIGTVLGAAGSTEPMLITGSRFDINQGTMSPDYIFSTIGPSQVKFVGCSIKNFGGANYSPLTFYGHGSASQSTRPLPIVFDNVNFFDVGSSGVNPVMNVHSPEYKRLGFYNCSASQGWTILGSENRLFTDWGNARKSLAIPGSVFSVANQRYQIHWNTQIIQGSGSTTGVNNEDGTATMTTAGNEPTIFRPGDVLIKANVWAPYPTPGVAPFWGGSTGGIDPYGHANAPVGTVGAFVGATLTVSNVPYSVAMSASDAPFTGTPVVRRVCVVRNPGYGNITSGSAVIASCVFEGVPGEAAPAANTVYEVGARVRGIGIPEGAYVVSATSTDLTISINCTANGTKVKIYDAEFISIRPDVNTYRIAATAITATETDHFIECQTAGLTHNLPLISAVPKGKVFVFQDSSGTLSTSAITIGRNSANINGVAANYTFNANYGRVTFTSDGTGWLAITDRQNGGQYRALWVPTQEMFASPANPATLTSVAPASSDMAFPVWSFADAATSNVQFRYILPDNYGFGNIKVKLIWTFTGATSPNVVVWQVSAGFVGSLGNLDATILGSAFGGTSTVDASAYHQNVWTSNSITIAGGPGLGNVLYIQINRLGAHASDTAAATAYLIGAEVQYLEDTTFPALW